MMVHSSDLDVRSRVGRHDLDPKEGSSSDTALHRRYVGPSGRQLHCLEAGTGQSGRPLYCLHATAYSGRSLTPLLRALSTDRKVVAIDTPGYGASDAPTQPLDVAGYARAIDTVLEASDGGEIDLFGYHTGALIAAEWARQRPDRVGRMILIGVPYFSGEEQVDWRRRLAQKMRLTEDFTQFADKWDFFIAERPAGVGLQRGFENFVDELRAYPQGWWAHDAAFRFDVEQCFAQIFQPTLIINPDNHLAPASRRAGAALKHGQMLEMPHLENGIFDVAAEEIAKVMNVFLAAETDSR